MAQNITSFPAFTPVGASYLYGNVKDDTGSGDGTPFSVQVLGDLFQLPQRVAAQGGITLNNQPDNDTNGWQFSKAFGGEAWDEANDIVLTPDTGSVTVGVGDIRYSRYLRVGRKVLYQMQLGGVDVSGSPTLIFVKLPFLPNNWVNDRMRVLGVYGTGTPLPVQMTVDAGDPTAFGFYMIAPSGTFPTSAASSFFVQVEGEI